SRDPTWRSWHSRQPARWPSLPPSSTTTRAGAWLEFLRPYHHSNDDAMLEVKNEVKAARHGAGANIEDPTHGHFQRARSAPRRDRPDAPRPRLGARDRRPLQRGGAARSRRG